MTIANLVPFAIIAIALLGLVAAGIPAWRWWKEYSAVIEEMEKQDEREANN